MNQEMIRRMTNTSELVDVKIRIEIVDEYAQKLINSVQLGSGKEFCDWRA